MLMGHKKALQWGMKKKIGRNPARGKGRGELRIISGKRGCRKHWEFGGSCQEKEGGFQGWKVLEKKGSKRKRPHLGGKEEGS